MRTEEATLPDVERPARRLVGRPGHNAGQTFTPEPLSADEVVRLCAAMNKGATGDRNRAAVALMYRAGLRLAEALALRPGDIDRDAQTVLVRKGKGGKPRTVAIDAGGLLMIERWLARRRDLDLPPTAPLLCKLNGSPWAPQAVRRVLRDAATRAGITKRVHPHGLRHSHAVRLDESGMRISLISRQLGHSSLTVTSIYLNHVSPAQLVQAIDAVAFEPEPAEAGA